MGRRRRVSPERRHAGRAGFVLLALGVSALALLLGFLVGLIVIDREEGAPPAPAARPVTIEETVQAPEKTVPATTYGFGYGFGHGFSLITKRNTSESFALLIHPSA